MSARYDPNSSGIAVLPPAAWEDVNPLGPDPESVDRAADLAQAPALERKRLDAKRKEVAALATAEKGAEAAVQMRQGRLVSATVDGEPTDALQRDVDLGIEEHDRVQRDHREARKVVEAMEARIVEGVRASNIARVQAKLNEIGARYDAALAALAGVPGQIRALRDLAQEEAAAAVEMATARHDRAFTLIGNPLPVTGTKYRRIPAEASEAAFVHVVPGGIPRPIENPVAELRRAGR